MVHPIIFQYSFPFYGIYPQNDPFDYPLATLYDPSYPIQTQQLQNPPSVVPKVQEKTSPEFVKQEPVDILPQLCLSQKKQKMGKNKKQKRQSKNNDGDFRPYDRKKTGKKIHKQKLDRNLIPNTVHHLLAFVQKQFKSSYLVQNIINGIPHNPNFTVLRFYTYHKMLRTKINNYVNEEAMKIIITSGSLQFTEYSEQEQEFYALVCRILIRKFFKLEAVLMILLSRKVRKENILDHLSVQRFLLENMRASQ